MISLFQRYSQETEFHCRWEKPITKTSKNSWLDELNDHCAEDLPSILCKPVHLTHEMFYFACVWLGSMSARNCWLLSARIRNGECIANWLGDYFSTGMVLIAFALKERLEEGQVLNKFVFEVIRILLPITHLRVQLILEYFQSESQWTVASVSLLRLIL
jgi:hypothetical protein